MCRAGGAALRAAAAWLLLLPITTAYRETRSGEALWTAWADPAMREAMMRSMTLQEALDLLKQHPDAPPQLLAVATALAKSGGVRGGRFQAADGQMSTESALGMLNKLVADAERKKDLECRQCYDYQEKKRGVLLTMHDDMSIDSADMIAARQDVLKAENTINAVNERVATTEEMIQVLGQNCDGGVADLQNQLSTLAEDISFMERTTGDMFCSSQLAFLIQHCRRGTAQVKSKHRSRCWLHRNQKCERVRELFLQLQTQTVERKDSLHHELQARASSCTEARGNYRNQISSLEAHNTDQQTRLALAMAKKNEADERLHAKVNQVQVQKDEWSAMARHCKQAIEGIEKQICGLRRIRGELQRMAGEDTAIRDCEVTPWVPEECPVSCGGGNQKITRRVIMHPDKGAPCPPLEGVQRCNEEPCPVSCHLAEWSGWSGCSAMCGGGIRERERGVITRARHGGDPCGATVMTQPCAQKPCDRDCLLAPWGAWSPCSLACGGGLMSRVRRVHAPPMGAGSCPSVRSHVRLQYEKCNVQACGEDDETATCGRKLDVVLLLDGGGSLGSLGWEQVKEAAAGLASLMDGGPKGVSMAVQLFSGPKTTDDYAKCTAASDTSEDWLSMCGIKWVSHLTEDTGSVESQIRALKPMGGSSFLSAALALARAEFSLGRRDADRVVVVMTDRKPLNPTRVHEVAARLQREARLVWVPISRHAPVEYFKTLASRPVRDNLLFVEDFAQLANASTVDVILRSICYQLQ